jgi:hypothetical protein
MLCHTSNHWGHRNCEQKFTKISGNNIRTTLNRFPTKKCHTRNITHHKESATSWNLKPECWGSPLAQEEKYQAWQTNKRLVKCSVIYKIGSGTQWPNIRLERCYIYTRKKGSGKVFRLASFWKRTSETAFRRIPSQKYPWLNFILLSYDPSTLTKMKLFRVQQ